jgi:hypothetical protein
MSFRFDGTAKSYPDFKEAMIKWADREEFPWMIRGGNVICAIYQAANAKAAKGTRSNGSTGTISLDIQGKAYDQDQIKAELNRKVARALHDAVFSNEAKTPEPVVITKLRPILKDPEVVKILAVDQLGTEE